MVKLNDIKEYLFSFAPSCFAEDYDNVGLLVETENKDICKVLITLDTDEAVVEEAIEKGCNLIISHHPLIFQPIKRLLCDDAISRTISKLIKNDISLISMHTNFDSVKNGLCDLFLDKIAKTKEKRALIGDVDNGSGRLAFLEKETSISDILITIKNEFKLNYVKYIGNPCEKIKTIALCNGGGADFIYTAKEQGADVYISGDFKYHHARYAYENMLSLIEIPHYNAEIIFCEYMKKLLNKKYDNCLDVYVTDQNKDIWENF